MKRNPLFLSLSDKYLFHDIKIRVEDFRKSNQGANIISLGIGDTTEPLPPPISEAIQKAGIELGTPEGYRGYGSELGLLELRERIKDTYYQESPLITSSDIFISDGAKCDIGRLQLLFGVDTPIAVQDPSYPAYRDSSFFVRNTPPIPLPCIPGESLPDLTILPEGSMVFLCSPNNPTGAMFSFDELETYVRAAQKKKHLIVFDVAYRSYAANTPGFPLSIYEVPGAETVAIEIGSFSKSAGFSGLRLGWTIIPSQLCYHDGHSIQKDFARLVTTIFNGASYITQMAGLHALSQEGQKATQQQVACYKNNAKLLKQAILESGGVVSGGDNSPYLWVKTRFNKSWDAFDYFLQHGHIVTTPGVGFGSHGEGFLRFSGFGKTAAIEEAARRISKLNLRDG